MLKLTGMSYEIAKFQASSAFTGTGFSTNESEIIVSHPVRRKIITFLMFIGNVGFITFISSLIISLTNANDTNELLVNTGIIVAGTILLFIISRSKYVDKFLALIIEYMLRKWTKLEITDFENLLNLSENYEVSKTTIDEDSPLSCKTLTELRLSDRGILILGIKRPGQPFIGTPSGETKLEPKDELVLYGQEDDIKSLTNNKDQ